MDKDWNLIILIKPEKGKVHKIASWADLSEFLLCHWPMKHGSAYTAAVCNLAQSYYNNIDTENLIKAFLSALDEAGIPYRFEVAIDRANALAAGISAASEMANGG